MKVNPPIVGLALQDGVRIEAQVGYAPYSIQERILVLTLRRGNCVACPEIGETLHLEQLPEEVGKKAGTLEELTQAIAELIERIHTKPEGSDRVMIEIILHGLDRPLHYLFQPAQGEFPCTHFFSFEHNQAVS